MVCNHCISPADSVLNIALKSKFTTDQLVSQLEREYGVLVDLGEDVSPGLGPPKEKEWTKSLLQSFENMRTDSKK